MSTVPASGGATSVSAWASVVKKSTAAPSAGSKAGTSHSPALAPVPSSQHFSSHESSPAAAPLDWASDVPDFPPGLGLSPAFSPSGMSSSSENVDVVSPLSVPSALPVPGAGTAVTHDGAGSGYGKNSKGSLTGSFSRMNLSNSDMDGSCHSAPVSVTDYDPEEEYAEEAEAEWPVKASAVIVTSGTITTLTNKSFAAGGEWEEGDDGIVPSYSWDAQPDPEDMEPICNIHGAGCKRQTCPHYHKMWKEWEAKQKRKVAEKGESLFYMYHISGELMDLSLKRLKKRG